MNEIMPYVFEGHQVRTSMLGDKPYFCLADVCRILDIKSPSDVAKRLVIKGTTTIGTPTSGGLQELLFVSEDNLYRVIFQSRKLEAERFQKWVFEDVLPSIRKTGSYQTKPMSAIDQYEAQVRAMLAGIEALRAVEAKQQALEEKTDRTDKRVGEIYAHLSEHDEGYFAIRGWYNNRGCPLTEEAARNIGMIVSKYCRRNGIEVHRKSDAKWGHLNTYPIDVLENIDMILSEDLERRKAEEKRHGI
jgi:prophage antirepressor-like protein